MLMAGVNNVITNIFPLQVKNGIDAGLVAGLIDGFCYVGSATASFGLGSMKESTGDWNIIMYVFLGLTVACVLTVAVYVITQTILKKKSVKKEI
jgi:sugar phosphate permease